MSTNQPLQNTHFYVHEHTNLLFCLSPSWKTKDVFQQSISASRSFFSVWKDIGKPDTFHLVCNIKTSKKRFLKDRMMQETGVSKQIHTYILYIRTEIKTIKTNKLEKL